MNRLIVFLVAFLLPVRFKLVGEIGVGELLVPVLLVLNWKLCLGSLKESGLARIFLGFGVCYLLALVASDLFRNTTAVDYVRGWARVGVFLMSVFTFLGTCKLEGAIKAFLWGSVFSVIPVLIMDGIQPFDAMGFKWTYGKPLSTSVLLYSGRFYGLLPLLCVSLAAGVGGFSFVQNFRSLAGILVFTSFYLFLRKLPSFEKISLGGVAIIGLTGVCAAFLIFNFYTWAAPQGMLGESAREKFEMQVRKSPDGEFSLLSGRQELYFCIPKIIESPLVGWGSWAKDYDFVMERHAELHGKDVRLGGSAERLGRIPVHSHITQAWIESGAVGGLFWLTFLLLVIFNLFLVPPSSQGSLYPVFVFVCISLVWDLCFSPFGAGRRVDMGFFLAWQIGVHAQAIRLDLHQNNLKLAQ